MEGDEKERDGGRNRDEEEEERDIPLHLLFSNDKKNKGNLFGLTLGSCVVSAVNVDVG